VLVYYLEYRGYWVELPRGETLVGRDQMCTLRFNDPSISRRHARFVHGDDSVTIQDLRSSNGTLVNGVAVTRSIALADGDMIAIGTRELVFRALDEGEQEETTRSLATFVALGEIDDAPPVMTKPLVRALSPSSDPSDRRAHPRVSIELPIVYHSDELEVEATTRDLSHSGVFVNTEVLEPLGTRCRLTIDVAGESPIELHGIVRRVVERAGAEPVGLGIEFVMLGPDEREWLERTLATTPAK
jgi:hypothetical protein